MTTYKLRNNSVRGIGLCGRVCQPFAGVMPPKQFVPLGTTQQLFPFFTMTEEEMFRGYRGVVPHMTARVMYNGISGEMELDVLADGVEPKLTVDALKRAMDEYRDKHGHKKPERPEDVTAELERAMNRPEDPVEKSARVERERRDHSMVKAMQEANRDMVTNLVKELFDKKFAELAAEPEPTPPKGDAPKPSATAPTPPVKR